MTPQERLQAVDSEAQSQDLVDLSRICRVALKLEGSLRRFAPRAAISKLAEGWLDALSSESPQPDAKLLAQRDIQILIESLQELRSRELKTVGPNSDERVIGEQGTGKPGTHKPRTGKSETDKQGATTNLSVNGAAPAER